MKGNDAAAAVAIRFVAHHALAFVLSRRPERESLQSKLAIVRDPFRVLRPHQLKRRVHHIDDAGILALEREDLIYQRVARGPIEPESLVQICDRREEVEDDAAARNRTPLLNQVLYAILGDARQHAGDLDFQLRVVDDVLFDLLVDAGSAHPRERLFRAVDGDNVVAIVPVGQCHRAVGDDRVVLEILASHFDQLLTHQWLAADPRAEHHRMPGGLHLFQLLDPLLYGKLFLPLVVFSEEVAVLAAQVAAVRDIDGADSILRQAEGEKPRGLCEATKFPGNAHYVFRSDSAFA